MTSIPSTLRGDRVRLELLGEKHSLGMFALWSDPRVCEHSGSAEDFDGNSILLPARSPAESDRLIDFWVRRADAGTGVRWAVIRETDSEFIGAVGLNALGPCCELAYHVKPRFWGQGFATEACRIALDWTLETGAESVAAFIEDENQRSIALARRLGFERDPESGELPRRYLIRPKVEAG